MARKPDRIESLIDGVLSTASQAVGEKRKLVDIITFCEDPAFLNFLGQDPAIVLWPMQRIVLKLFYRGSEGNEHIELTDDEIAVLKDIAAHEQLDYDEDVGFGNVLDKYKRRDIEFTHLLLIMGRRSSKTMIVSIMAAYEAYKLCEAPDGNPQKKFGIAADKPIHIINVAVSEAQALDPLFAEIEARISRAPYFIDKINNESSIKGKIYLLTDADKRQNTERLKKGVSIKLPGSIILMSGHSNSGSLRGHATKCVFFDEFAHFISSTGRSSGDEVYNALTPSMKQFGKEGKVVMLSDPRGKEGMFWKLFQLAQQKKTDRDGVVSYPHDHILAIQLPTWRMNPQPDFSYDFLYRTERAKDPVAFLTSWNARFLGTEGAKFFDDSRIDDCIDFRGKELEHGNPNYVYYIHLDPATTSHNYALALVHTLPFINNRGEMKRKVFVDLVKFWKPDENGPVPIKEVEDCIKSLCRRFRVAEVTFDTWQSQQTIQNLKMCGINSSETQYRINYITEIYGELRNLVNQGDIVFYPNEQLIGEMKGLLYKIVNRGFKRFFDPKAAYPSDDCCDALAGAVFRSLNSQIVKQLPRSQVVYTGMR